VDQDLLKRVKAGWVVNYVWLLFVVLTLEMRSGFFGLRRPL
jgi:hypothetical protein